MKEENKEHNGQPYERPSLHEWGTVADMTAAGETGAGDVLDGSVNAPGACGTAGMMAAGGAACKVSF